MCGRDHKISGSYCKNGDFQSTTVFCVHFPSIPTTSIILPRLYINKDDLRYERSSSKYILDIFNVIYAYKTFRFTDSSVFRLI